MKKIPTLFKRIYENHKIVGIKDEITPGCERAFYQGIATVKFDGSCCAIINVVSVNDFDTNRWKECSTGIHFFMTREEAVEYIC